MPFWQETIPGLNEHLDQQAALLSSERRTGTPWPDAHCAQAARNHRDSPSTTNMFEALMREPSRFEVVPCPR